MSKMRNRNGYGTIVKLSGKRRKPFEVRVNTRMDSRNYPVYDVLGRYSDRMEAQNALAAYNINPYNIDSDKMTFEDLYKKWYESKYHGIKKYSQSSEYCTQSAHKRCSELYDIPIKQLRSSHFQAVIDSPDLSHAMAEHIRNLFNQMFDYAMEHDYISKNYCGYIKINIEEDDISGVPFSQDDIKKLWDLYYSGERMAALPLILIYSGWRITEFITCSIDLDNKTMTGGVKTKAGKNRTIPIHSKIFDLVKNDMEEIRKIDKRYMNDKFRIVLAKAGIKGDHTCHDCRHTFASLLSSAGVPEICIKRLLGHANKDITGLYTHKEVEELRQEIEKI